MVAPGMTANGVADTGVRGARVADFQNPDSQNPDSQNPGAQTPNAQTPGAQTPGAQIPDTEILVADPRWHGLVPQVARLVRRAHSAAGGGAEAVVLDRDRSVKRLNARYRGRNKPTNVLTFENGPTPAAGVGACLGSIVVALETVRREARAAGRPASHHLAHLVVHGALHLHGHDHHAAGAARRMEMREALILRRLGLPNPWKSRSIQR